MANQVKITLPKLGESITSATVVKWFKNEGDFVKEDEPLLEVTTDKVNSEIPSTATGVLQTIVAKNDQEVEVGDDLAIISCNTQETAQGDPEEVHQQDSQPVKVEEVELATPSQQSSKSPGKSEATFLSPAVLRLATQAGISVDDVMKMTGSGEGGRVTKKDIQDYIENKSSGSPATAPEGPTPVEKVKMTGMRKAIADNMVRSFYEAPHASLITEVDVTGAMQYLAKEKESFLKEHGYKLTITSIIAKAITEAVKEYPLINSSLQDDTIVIKRFVNLGIAVSVDQGVMVPVIKNCHSKSLQDIAKEVADLSKKARDSALKPDDTKEGSITMTNFGMAGTLIGVPIIRYPEVAIVGIGAIKKQVAVLDDNSFGIRQMLHISLTFDHRVLDGMYGCGFLSSVKTHLENYNI